MRKVVTWVLVADGQRARILINDGPNRGLKEDEDRATAIVNPANREQLTDRPGRSFDRMGPGHHAMEEVDAHRETKVDFAKGLAQWLRDAVLNKEMDRLILVAPPKTLGDLRGALDKKVAEIISAEIPSDLTNHTVPDIEKSVAKVLAV